MLVIVWEFIFCVFDAILLRQFNSIFLKEKKKPILYQISLILGASSLIFISSYIPVFSYSSTVIITLIIIGFSCLMYSGKVLYRILLPIVFEGLYLLYSVGLITVLSITSIQIVEQIYIYGSIIRISFIISTRIFLYLVFFFINKKIKKNQFGFAISENIFIISIICLFVTTVITNLFFSTDITSFKQEIYYILGGFVLLLIFFIFMERKQIQSILRIQQLEIQNEVFESNKIYFETKNEQDIELRKIKHDIKNNLLSLNILLQENKYIEAREYLDQLSTLPALKKQINTNNTILDSLLNINIQSNPDIKFHITINIIDFDINNVSLSIILGNALSNAVEATRKNIKSNNNIYINIDEDDKRITFIIENYYLDHPLLENNIFITTKDDAENHGYGLQNIQREVKKYNGKLSYDIERNNKKFILNILLLKK